MITLWRVDAVVGDGRCFHGSVQKKYSADLLVLQRHDYNYNHLWAQHPSNMLLLTKSQRGVHVTRETHNRKWPARPPVCHQSFSPLRQFVRIIIQHGATQRPSCFPRGGVPHFCFRICYNFSFLMLLRRSEKKWSLLSSKSEGPRLVKFRSPVSLHWDL